MLLLWDTNVAPTVLLAPIMIALLFPADILRKYQNHTTGMFGTGLITKKKEAPFFLFVCFFSRSFSTLCSGKRP